MAEEAHGILVMDLARGTTNHDVWHFALLFGPVKSTVLDKPKVGQAIILFEDEEGVNECLANYGDNKICGTLVNVRVALDDELVEHSSPSTCATVEDIAPVAATGIKDLEIYCCGIPAGITQYDIENHMATFGKVDNVDMTTHERDGGRSFAYVTFADKESAEKALQNFHFNAIGGLWFEVRPSIPENLNLYKYENEQISARKLYVNDVASSVSDTEFLDYFKAYGTILASHLRKGFGFVLYERPSSADRVLAQSDHRLHGRPLRLTRGSVEESRERRYRRLTRKYGMEVPDWPGNPELELYRDMPEEPIKTDSHNAPNDQDNDAWWWKGVNATNAWLDNEVGNESSALPLSESAYSSGKWAADRGPVRRGPY